MMRAELESKNEYFNTFVGLSKINNSFNDYFISLQTKKLLIFLFGRILIKKLLNDKRFH